MKVFVISLERAKRRRKYLEEHLNALGMEYELVDAVDGRMLTQDEIEKHCDMEAVRKSPQWLNSGAIGCALSHYEAYRRIVEQNIDCALILEDDVLLPQNILMILDEVEKRIKDKEVILLYYASHRKCFFSTVGQEKIIDGALCYPMDIAQPITTAAYVIKNQAAKNLKGLIKPIRAAADSWAYFYGEGGIDSLRCLFPSPIKTKDFRSSLDYTDPRSLKGRILELIDRYKIPIMYQYCAWRRRKKLNGMMNFGVTEEESKIHKCRY